MFLFTPRREPKIDNCLLLVRRNIPEGINLQESQVCQTLQLGLSATLQLKSTRTAYSGGSGLQ